MLGFSEFTNKSAIVIIGLGVILLIATALQYPLSTSFPIGPDAAAHVRDAQIFWGEYPGNTTGFNIITHHPYPLSVVALSLFRVLPISWPERFTWAITIAQIAAGLAVGLLLYRLSGYHAAAAGMAIWSLQTTGFIQHFESGTFPQLLSIFFLLMFFERLIAQSPLGSFIFFIATIFFHPISAIVLLATLAIVIPPFIINRRFLQPHEKRLLYPLAVIVLLVMFTSAYFVISWGFIQTFWAGGHLSINSRWHSDLAPWLVLSVPGWFLLNRLLRHILGITVINTFIFLSLLLAFNDKLGIDIWTERFRILFWVVITLTSAIALPTFIRLTFARIFTKATFTVLLFATLFLSAWQTNATLYTRVETPAKHARLHPNEMEAIAWLRDNTHKDAYVGVFYTFSYRNTEWIPVLGHRKYAELQTNDHVWGLQAKALHRNLKEQGFSYLVFFCHQDVVPKGVSQSPELFPVQFQMPDVLIVSLV